jgi:hypothetical protein
MPVSMTFDATKMNQDETRTPSVVKVAAWLFAAPFVLAPPFALYVQSSRQVASLDEVPPNQSAMVAVFSAIVAFLLFGVVCHVTSLILARPHARQCSWARAIVIAVPIVFVVTCGCLWMMIAG